MNDHDKKLWDRADEWRAKLAESYANRFSDDDNLVYPVLVGLEEAWQRAHDEEIEQGFLNREERVADNPINAALYYIDSGYMPPPELLMTMYDCFQHYKFISQDLERSIFGKPIQKAGNYAQRSDKKMRDMVISMEFAKFLNQGNARKEAAEKVSLYLDETYPHWAVEADYILRMMSGFGGFKVRQPSKTDDDPEK